MNHALAIVGAMEQYGFFARLVREQAPKNDVAHGSTGSP
jgi:hypothetical protein